MEPTVVRSLQGGAKRKEGGSLRLSSGVGGPKVKVLPRRCIVERTFSWLVRNRRLSKDYERMVQSSETFIKVAMIRLIVRRLARGG